MTSKRHNHGILQRRMNFKVVKGKAQYICQLTEENWLTCEIFLPYHRHFFFKFYLFIDWLHWVFVAVRGPSPVALSGGHSLLWCAGPSLQWPLLWSTGSRRAGFSSCGTRAQPLRGMWDPPRPGLEPASPALAGGLSTTAPPGKSRHF